MRKSPLLHRPTDQAGCHLRAERSGFCEVTGARRSASGMVGFPLVVVAFFSLLWMDGALAQFPGTPPPKQDFGAQDDRDPDELPIQAFMFESASGFPVVVPGISWEEIERLRNLDAGIDSSRQPFSYQSLEVTGTTEREIAELEVVVRLLIDSTQGRWVSIPLGMSNFHRLAPPDVSGVDEYRMLLAADGSGNVLMVKTNTTSEAMLRMRVRARVTTSSAARSLEFRLPDVPTHVELTTDAKNVSGEVVGRGDELKQQSTIGGRTKFTVDSGGSDFSIRWGRLSPSTDNAPLFGVVSDVSVRWDSPEDQPIASVRLSLRSVRGAIGSFQLRLPEGSVFLEPPRLGENGQTVELTGATSDGDGELREVIIPDDEKQQRIDLIFDLQLANENASSTSPLSFRVPEVVGSLTHVGEIEIQTSGDYRLRWRSEPWVRSELGESRNEDISGRSYHFRFDRASFVLPLWLGAKERQLRLLNNSKITVSESTASLEMTIQISGQDSGGRLQLDDASWQITSIEDLETGEPLESESSSSYHMIEFNSLGSEESPPILIRAEHHLGSGEGKAEFSLPRVMQVDETVLVQNATVDIINSGRRMLAVDLEESKGLSRLVSSVAEATTNLPVSSFRVSTQDAAAVVVGTMIDQPPRISLASDAIVELDGDQLRTTVDWEITSALDLEGRLPIRIPPVLQRRDTELPAIDSEGAEDEESDGAPGIDDSIPVIDLTAKDEPWVVTVDGVPAVMRDLDGDRYELISDRLTRGSMSIRWRHTQSRSSVSGGGSIESIALPRPNIADVEFQGTMQIEMRGSQQLDLISADAQTGTPLQLDSLPHDPIRLRLQTKTNSREELSIRQTILRTAIGRNTRHEQVMAKIQGGDQFRIGLPSTARDVSVEALVDRSPVLVRREGNALVVTLPGDGVSHVVDIRVWIAADTPSTFAVVKPTLQLPVGVGRVYWQIVAPRDSYVIWASPTVGRSMKWKFEPWRLWREPSHNDEDLTRLAGSTRNLSLPPGNRYLYDGADLRSFEVVVISRAVLWMGVSTMVLMIAVLLTYVPRSRHPLTAVVGAILFSGLIAIAPDAAVLAGQFALIALALVIVMFAVRSLLATNQSDRVFANSRGQSVRTPPSTRSLKKTPPPDAAGISATKSLPAQSQSEASS